MADERIQLSGIIPTPIKNILLVEDDITIAELLVQMIAQETHYQIFAVPDGPQALDIVNKIKPDLLILDYWLPSTHGIEVYDQLHNLERLKQVPAIMLSVDAPLREINRRQITYLRKPFDMYKLLEVINTFLV